MGGDGVLRPAHASPLPVPRRGLWRATALSCQSPSARAGRGLTRSEATTSTLASRPTVGLLRGETWSPGRLLVSLGHDPCAVQWPDLKGWLWPPYLLECWLQSVTARGLPSLLGSPHTDDAPTALERPRQPRQDSRRRIVHDVKPLQDRLVLLRSATLGVANYGNRHR